MPEGAQPGTVPTDIEQATGLERLEILGKMQGVDVFDMKPLPSDRLGTLDDPIMVKSFGDEQYCGCTGCPADSHHVLWLTVCDRACCTRREESTEHVGRFRATARSAVAPSVAAATRWTMSVPRTTTRTATTTTDTATVSDVLVVRKLCGKTLTSV